MGDSNSKSQMEKRWQQVFEPALSSDPGQTVLRYALAVLAAIAALLLRKALVPLLGEHNPYHIAWLAIVFSAWYCGFWQSLLALGIETLGIWYWILPTSGSWQLTDRNQIYGLVGFALFGSLLSILGESYRRTLARNIATEQRMHRAMAKARDELELRVEERTAELKRAEERFRSLLESAPDAMIVADQNGAILIVNSQAEKIFGYNRDELMGREVETLIPSRFHRRHLQHRKGFASEPRFRAMGEGLELYGLHKDGREFPVEISLSPIQTEHGLVFTSAIRDITQRKAVERAARELSARLLQMQDEERRRIARELHDSAGQVIALMMNVDQLIEMDGTGERKRLLSDSHALLQNLNKEVRTISHLLHPPLLDEVGLSSALQWYVDGFAKRSGIATTVEIGPEFGRLDSDAEITIFRMVQECLTNVHRHSGSRKAAVRLTRCSGEVRIEVLDEGKGIPAEKWVNIVGSGPVGVGLRGMRERITQLGGKLDVQSDSGGTKVAATLPIAKAARSALEVVA